MTYGLRFRKNLAFPSALGRDVRADTRASPRKNPTWPR